MLQPPDLIKLVTPEKSETDEIKKNTTEVDILKCRWTGYSGFVGSWYYDPISHTLYDKQDFMEQQRSNF